MTPSSTIQFLGGAETVTGSKHLVTHGGRHVLLDCGLFQGLKALRLRNWAAPRIAPSAVDTVLLSHAHIDHSGYVPVLVRLGFRGRIVCTSGTADLLPLLLRDSARLQEEEAAFANRAGYSKHQPALPLYTVQDVDAALRQCVSCGYGEPVTITDDVRAIFRRAGHILGSATIELQLGWPDPYRLVFSGDLGRWNQPIIRDPEWVPEADVLLLEATYGDRLHAGDPTAALARVVQEAAARGGALLVPAFAVGRTQELVWLLRELEAAGRIPTLPVYIDSPMATQVAAVYSRHPEDQDRELAMIGRHGTPMLSTRRYHLVTTPEGSNALKRLDGPIVIISGSGMATGGRILQHLTARLPDPKTTVLLVGFQAEGTRGRALQEGAAAVKIHGEQVPVRAHIETLDGLSAHADQQEILRWLSGFSRPPRHTYVVHAEVQQAEGLVRVLRERLGWTADVARDGQVVELV